MVELEYYKAKSKLLEYQAIQLQLQAELQRISAEKTAFLNSLGLDPTQNYLLDDSNLEIKNANSSNESR